MANTKKVSEYVVYISKDVSPHVKADTVTHDASSNVLQFHREGEVTATFREWMGYIRL